MRARAARVGLVAWVGFVVSASAFAQGSSLPPLPPKKIHFEELLDRCVYRQDSKYGNFLAVPLPKDVVVHCSETRFDWKASQPGAFPLEARRWVSASVSTDRLEVPTETLEFPIEARRGSSCPIYKQVRRTTTFSARLNCDALMLWDLGRKGMGMNDLCNQLLARGRGETNAKVDEVETGRMINTCAGVAITGGPASPDWD